MEDLDERVCDACLEDAMGAINEAEDPDEQSQLIGQAEARAAAINNQGEDVQRRFLAGDTVD